jgi:hypothetical protein
MDSLMDKARGGQNILERIANHIPGFKGYREKELRRDADRIQREHLAGRLEETKKSLDALAAAASRVGALDAINDIETARKRLDRVVARIRYADRGYSAFFDRVKIDEAMLERVYDFDLLLLDGVEQVRAAAARGSAEPAPAVRDMIAQLDALDTKMGERDTLLSGVGAGGGMVSPPPPARGEG